jgi:hypothetical protein
MNIVETIIHTCKSATMNRLCLRLLPTRYSRLLYHVTKRPSRYLPTHPRHNISRHPHTPLKNRTRHHKKVKSPFHMTDNIGNQFYLVYKHLVSSFHPFFLSFNVGKESTSQARECHLTSSLIRKQSRNKSSTHHRLCKHLEQQDILIRILNPIHLIILLRL